MKYDAELEIRLDRELTPLNVVKKKMFGGLCYLLKGNMLLGVHKDTLILRLGVEQSEATLGQPGVNPFDITGKPMKGWVMVEKSGFEGAKLGEWIAKARK